jgi:hypothetical protein
MESKSRSALWPNRIAYLLHGDTNVACLLDYQSFSMDSSPIEQIFGPAFNRFAGTSIPATRSE